VSGLPAGPFVVTLAAAAAALLVMMAVTFAVALKAGKHSVVDTAWGIGIAVVATVALVSSLGYGRPARRYILLAAAVIWGLRLAVYIGSRNRGKPEDPRYRDLLSKAKGDKNIYALRTIYLLQALILWVACLPIQAGMLERAPAGPLTVIGAVLWLGGFVFESVGDWQLARFKADPTHKGIIMDRGLWRYTRHPNYFGDFCMWWGLFLISLGSWVEVATIVGPLLMTFLLTRGSGQALTERRADQWLLPPAPQKERHHGPVTSDGPTSDGPTSDGPTSDGPTSDGPTSDGMGSGAPSPRTGPVRR
jgi:steroid 5-alpha reductase family enzyme